MNRVVERNISSRTGRWAGWIASLGIVVGVLAVLATFLPGQAYRHGLIHLGTAFKIMLGYGFRGGLLAAAMSLVGLLLALFARAKRQRWRAVAGLVLGLIAFLPPMMFVHKAESVPGIHDITTDTADPPAFQAVLALRKGAPNSPVYGGAKVAAAQHAAYPDIQPLRFDVPPPRVFDAALDTAKSMGWTIVAQVPAEGRIEATATTFWFGFKDDVVLRVRPDVGGARLDVRSESRVGGSDVGANAARIRVFRKELDATLARH